MHLKTVFQVLLFMVFSNLVVFGQDSLNAPRDAMPVHRPINVEVNSDGSTSTSTPSSTAKPQKVAPPKTSKQNTASTIKKAPPPSIPPPPSPEPVAVAEQKEIALFETNIDKASEGYELQIKAIDEQSGSVDQGVNGPYAFAIGKSEDSLVFSAGIATKSLDALPSSLYVKHLGKDNKAPPKFLSFSEAPDTGVQQGKIPLWLSILPPLVAIIMALIFKEVLISLFVGIWVGAFILAGSSLKSIGGSFFEVLEKYIVNAMADTDHLSVIVFSMLIGGMVAIISKNGGMAGVVEALSRFAKSAKSSQLVTWFLGLAIFFDDYANTLIVGSTARSLTDRYRVSREKLAYIVDSTAAPVAAVALITTWIGAELGYISDAAATIGIEESAYSIFLNSLTYSFYPFYALLFILMLVLMQRDYGPMLKAELRAREKGKLFNVKSETDSSELELDELEPIKGAPLRAYNAIIPVATVILTTIVGLVYTGYDPSAWKEADGFFTNLSTVIGNSNSYAALLWSSLLGVLVATLLSVGGRIMGLGACMDSMLNGFKTMMPAMVILILAWSLAQVTKDLHTADFLTSLMEGRLQPRLLPMITFVFAGIIAFSTGSSWSTMAILYPLILPATWQVCGAAGLDPDLTMAIFYNVTSCVLAGSVFGDHCSPISDTTILSSLASSCNHLDHVRTQLPYALTVGLVSILMGTLSVYISLPAIVHFIIGAALLFGIVMIFGKSVPNYDRRKFDEDLIA